MAGRPGQPLVPRAAAPYRVAMTEGRFRRELGSLESLVTFTAAFFDAHGIDASHRFDVDLIIEELFTNCVKYHPEGAAEIRVALDWSPPMLTIVLRDDDVQAFDITQVPEVDVN